MTVGTGPTDGRAGKTGDPGRSPDGTSGPREEKGMGSRARVWGSVLAKLLLTVAVTWLILRMAGIGPDEIGTIDWSRVNPHPLPLVLSVALLAATLPITAALWCRVLDEFGEPGVRLADAAAILLVANLGRYLPGKIMQLAGVGILARQKGLSATKATAAAIANQILNMVGAALCGGWVIATRMGTMGTTSILVGLLAVLAAAAFLYFGGAGALLGWLLRRTGSADDLPRPSGRGLALLLPGYLFNWALHGLAFACLAWGVGMETGLVVATTAFAAAYFAGYIALFAPAGIGVRESGLAGLLAPVVGVEAGVVLAALQRIWITGVELVGAVVGVLVLRRPPPSVAGGMP